jgi:hypothetical protein
VIWWQRRLICTCYAILYVAMCVKKYGGTVSLISVEKKLTFRLCRAPPGPCFCARVEAGLKKLLVYIAWSRTKNVIEFVSLRKKCTPTVSDSKVVFWLRSILLGHHTTDAFKSRLSAQNFSPSKLKKIPSFLLNKTPNIFEFLQNSTAMYKD